MRTLSKSITRQFYTEYDGFDQLRQRWAKLVQDKEEKHKLTAEHFLLYAALRGTDYSKGFSGDTTMECELTGPCLGSLNRIKAAVTWLKNTETSKWTFNLSRAKEGVEALKRPFQGLPLSENWLDLVVSKLPNSVTSEPYQEETINA